MSDKMEKLSLEFEQVEKDKCPFTPKTCCKKLKVALSEIDDMVTFKKYEGMSNFEGEYKSLQLSIKDANVATLQEEIVHLKAELKQCIESSDLEKKDANIKLFRLQQELEQKNIEILLLKKDKSEFDLQINLLKSRCARKEKDLQDALNISHPCPTETNDADSEIANLKSDLDKLNASQELLQEELEKSRHKIKNLEEILKIKSDHTQLLSIAFDELLNDFKQISTEASAIIEQTEIYEPCTFDPLEPLDLSVLNDMNNLINAEISQFSLENYSQNTDTFEVESILKEAVSNITLWFKSVLDEWQSHIQETTIPDNHDIDELVTIYYSLKNNKLASICEAATSMIATDTKEMCVQTSFAEHVRNSEEDIKNVLEIEQLKKEMMESKTKLDSLTTDFENKISSLIDENTELVQKYNRVKDILQEAEKHQTLVEETTAEVNKQQLNSEEESKCVLQVEQLKKELMESETKLEKLKTEYETKIHTLIEENKELIQKYNSVKDILQEAEKHQSFVEETTAEVVKELKEELGDRTVKILLNGGQEDFNDVFVDVVIKEESQCYQTSGMTTFLSAKEETEPSLCVEAEKESDVTLSVNTAYALPREHSDNLVSFAREFAEFLLANQVFHPDDSPPSDPSVFYFLLDKYLMLVETYHQARSAFEENLKELEEQDKVTTIKAEALLSQLSQLEVTDSTLCDSSFTASSVDFDTDVRSSTMYGHDPNNTSLHLQSFAENHDLTHDPLQITNTVPNTPVMAKSRLSLRDATPGQRRSSLNHSKIPISRHITPSVPMRNLNKNSQTHSILLNASVNDSMLPPTTPVQKILRREPCSTAKKSVKFQSPLLAKSSADYENSRLKAVLEEKLSVIEKLEQSIAKHVSNITEIEKRVEELEKLSSEAYNTLERAESEFSEKREKMEEELNNVKCQLADVTNKLIVEAINLNPDLQNRLTAITPPQVLKILLDTIIARCEKEQEEAKKSFEQDREEWASEIVLVTTENKGLQQKLDDLTTNIKQLQLQCEEMGVLEEDLLRLTGENIQLEKTNANLEKDSKALQDKLSEVEAINQEMIVIKDKLFMALAEKECLVSDKSQLEQDKEKLGKEYDNQIVRFEDSLVTKNEEIRLLNLEITELRNNTALLEDTNAKNLKEKDDLLSTLREELDTVKTEVLTLKNQELIKSCEESESLKMELEKAKKDHLDILSEKNALQENIDNLKVQIITLENQVTNLQLAETNAFNSRAEDFESLKLELENLRKEYNDHLKIVEDKNQALLEELDLVKKQVVTLETEIADLHLVQTNADNNSAEEIKSLQKDINSMQEELEVGRSKIIALNNDLSDLQSAKTSIVVQLNGLQLELESSKIENSNFLAKSEENDQMLSSLKEQLKAEKKQVIVLENEIAGLKLNQSNADSEKSENLNTENSAELKLLTEKNQILQEQLDTFKNRIETDSETDKNRLEELESVKLALENSAKEKKNLELQNEEFQLSFNHISAEKNAIESNFKMAESAIETISQKFMCDSLEASDLASKIHYLCGLVTKKLNDLVEDNKRIILLEREITEVKNEKEQTNVLMKEVEAKVCQLEEDKCNIGSEVTKLKQQIAEMEAVSDKLQSEIKEKDEHLLNNATESELLKTKVAEKAEELKSNEEKLMELNQLQEQKLLAEAKQVEIINLQADKQRILDELNCLKAEKEDILSKMASQFESEIEKHNKAQQSIENLQKQVNDLQDDLKDVRVLEGTHKTELDVITIEKSKLEECLSVVETNLRLAEERVISAEARNFEFEAELLLLKEELVKNKKTFEELSEKLSELEKSNEDTKSQNTDLIEKLNNLTNLNTTLNDEKIEINGRLESILVEKDDLLKKFTNISNLKNQLEEDKASLATKLNDLKKSHESLNNEKDEISFKLTELTEKYTSENSEMLEQLTKLEETKLILTSEKQNLVKDLAEVNSSIKILNLEKIEFEQIKINDKNEKDVLNLRLNELVQAREALQIEKDLLVSKINELNEALSGFTSEKDSIFNQLQTVVGERSQIINENKILQSKLSENEEVLKSLTEEKSILIAKLDEITQSRDILETENKTLTSKVEELTNDLVEKSKKITELINKIEFFDHNTEKLKEKLEEYKKTECTMLKKLLEKNSSDEMVYRLQGQLKDAEIIISRLNSEVEEVRQELIQKTSSFETAEAELFVLRNEVKQLKGVIAELTKDNDALNNNFKEQSKELRFKSQSLDDVTALMENLKCEVTKKEKESEQANSLLNERAEKINNLNDKMEKLSNNNAELKELLNHVQVALGLPEEAIHHLSADQNTRSYLRLFKDNVDEIKTKNNAISAQNEKLTIELEKLTTEKVQFKIKETEFLNYGRDTDDKIQNLTNKLMKLESAPAPSRRSKRQDSIGARRLDKLEELNTTLHDLLIKLLTMLHMPNVDKLRLISLREVDGATKQILDHAASLANARESLEALKEQIKSLDQENQELSDNFEALLKDNNKLELRIVELEKSHKSADCSVCAKLRKSLKEKTDQVEELNSKIKELDEENESLSNDVESLLKDNNKLELELLEAQKGSESAKSCVACNVMKNNLKSKEEEIRELEATIKKNAEQLETAEKELSKLKAQCEQLELTLSNKEQYLLRAINDRVRGDEVRMSSGFSGGLVRDIDLNEKLRRLTKDNDALKVLLRERARTIKKYEAEQKSSHLTNAEPNPVTNTNCMDSPIRERSYNLRTRADLQIGNKRSLRPHSEGIENIRI